MKSENSPHRTSLPSGMKSKKHFRKLRLSHTNPGTRVGLLLAAISLFGLAAYSIGSASSTGATPRDHLPGLSPVITEK